MRVILCSRLGRELQEWTSPTAFADDVCSGTVVFEDGDKINFDALSDAEFGDVLVALREAFPTAKVTGQS